MTNEYPGPDEAPTENIDTNQRMGHGGGVPLEDWGSSETIEKPKARVAREDMTLNQKLWEGLKTLGLLALYGIALLVLLIIVVAIIGLIAGGYQGLVN